MKDRILWNLSLGLALILLPLTGGCLKKVSSSPEIVAATEQPPPETDTALAPAPVGETLPADPASETDISDAPVTSFSTEKTLPADVKPSGPVLQAIQMANSGVDEGVMLAFVTNSTSTFNLRADEIIYLNDIGVPGGVVTAMIQRDEVLKQLPASATPVAPAPAVVQPLPAPDSSATYAAAPTPAEGAPPMEYAQEAYPPPPVENVSSPVFYDDLSPYGNWVEVGDYGLCWQPSVVVLNPGWQPYFDGGRWIYTDCGWYWMSDYSWGWAPFHYGRWFRHHHLGWCWRPDRVWGPSWVSWRYSDSYCGWAPLPPGGHFTVGIGLHDYERHVGRLSRDSYHFIAWNHFRDHHLGRYAVSREEVNRFYGRTVQVTRIVGNNNRVINNAIPPERVAAATRTPVRPVALRDVNAASASGVRAERLTANGRTLNVFRPVTPQSPNPRTSVVQRTTAQGNTGGRIAFTPSTTTPGLTPAPGAQLAERTSVSRVPNRLPAPKDESRPASGSVSVPTPSVAGQPVAGSQTLPASRSTPAVAPTINRNQRPVSTVVRIPANNTRPASSAPNHAVSQGQPAAPQTSASSAGNAISAETGTPTRSGQRAPTVIPRVDRSSRISRTQPATPIQSASPGANVIQTPQPASRLDTPRPSVSHDNSRFSAPSSAPVRTAPAAAPRYTPAPVERSRADFAPSRTPDRAPQPSFSAPERPSRSEVRESRSTSSSPAASSSSRGQSSPDRSDRGSDRSSRR